MMNESVLLAVGLGGLMLLLSGVWEQWRASTAHTRDSPEENIPAQNEAPPVRRKPMMAASRPTCEKPLHQFSGPRVVPLQRAGCVSQDQVVSAADKFVRQLRQKGGMVGLSRETRQELVTRVRRLLRDLDRGDSLDASGLLIQFEDDLIVQLEHVMYFQTDGVSDETISVAQALAKRALTLLTLASRYECYENFALEGTINMLTDPEADALDLARAVELQVRDVESHTKNGEWHRFCGIPVRIGNFGPSGEEVAVFALTRGSEQVGLSTFLRISGQRLSSKNSRRFATA